MISFHIPQGKKKRVLIVSDVKNEVDDQFAIVHALLSESLEVRGIIPTHFSWKKADSQRDSAQELEKLLDLMGLTGRVTVADGAQDRLDMLGKDATSPGAQLILAEAEQADARPLYIACLGPLTDMALALRHCPQLAQRPLTVLWIGGLGTEEGGAEPNLRSDVRAAQEVFDSGVSLWQIPREAYSMLPVSFAELYARVRPHGAIGRYLAENVVSFNNGGMRKPAEYRVLGDSAAIGLLLCEECGTWHTRNAPIIREDMRYEPRREQHPIRVYSAMDSRFILEDFYAKLLWMEQEETL